MQISILRVMYRPHIRRQIAKLLSKIQFRTHPSQGNMIFVATRSGMAESPPGARHWHEWKSFNTVAFLGPVLRQESGDIHNYGFYNTYIATVLTNLSYRVDPSVYLCNSTFLSRLNKLTFWHYIQRICLYVHCTMGLDKYDDGTHQLVVYYQKTANF